MRPSSIVDTLENAGDLGVSQLGCYGNTLIIFTSDEGPCNKGGGEPNFFQASHPSRGMKRYVYDGGIHVPMIVSWPRAISQAREDITPWAFADVIRPIAEVAQVSLESMPRVSTNGVSIRGLWQDNPESIPEQTLYWELGKQAGAPNSGLVGNVFKAAQRGNWKAVRYRKEARIELCNLGVDPSEQIELSN